MRLKFWFEILKGREGLDANGKIILKWILGN
jgi:hypothetical protein